VCVCLFVRDDISKTTSAIFTWLGSPLASLRPVM